MRTEETKKPVRDFLVCGLSYVGCFGAIWGYPGQRQGSNPKKFWGYLYDKKDPVGAFVGFVGV